MCYQSLKFRNIYALLHIIAIKETKFMLLYILQILRDFLHYMA